MFPVSKESPECVAQDLKLSLHMKNELRQLFGWCGMDSGPREVEAILPPVKGHPGQARERTRKRMEVSAWLPL